MASVNQDDEKKKFKIDDIIIKNAKKTFQKMVLLERFIWKRVEIPN